MHRSCKEVVMRCRIDSSWHHRRELCAHTHTLLRIHGLTLNILVSAGGKHHCGPTCVQALRKQIKSQELSIIPTEKGRYFTCHQFHIWFHSQEII